MSNFLSSKRNNSTAYATHDIDELQTFFHEPERARSYSGPKSNVPFASNNAASSSGMSASLSSESDYGSLSPHSQSLLHAVHSDRTLPNSIEIIYMQESEESALFRHMSADKLEMSDTMRQQQEAQIREAFFEVDMLRAKLKDLYNHNGATDKILVLFSKSSLAEVSARTAYQNIVYKSIDKNSVDESLEAEWSVRVRCDEDVVQELAQMKADPEQNKSLDKRTKRKFDLNRAKSILSSDQKALAKIVKYRNRLSKSVATAAAGSSSSSAKASSKASADVDDDEEEEGGIYDQTRDFSVFNEEFSD